MPDTVTSQVADQLAIRTDESERMLLALARLIKQQTERDGRVRVPGLGVFDNQDGTLTFTPDPALAEAVNHWYAALEPVVLDEEARAADPPASAGPDDEAPTEASPDAPDALHPDRKDSEPTVVDEPVAEATFEEPTSFHEPLAEAKAADEAPVENAPAEDTPLEDAVIEPASTEEPRPAEPDEEDVERLVPAEDEARSEWAPPVVDEAFPAEEEPRSAEPAEADTTDSDEVIPAAAVGESENVPAAPPEASVEPPPRERAPELPPQPAHRHQRVKEEDKRRSPLLFVLIALGLIVVGIGTMYAFGVFDGEPAEPVTAEETPQPVVEDEPPQTSAPAQTPEEEGVGEEAGPPAATAPPAETEAPIPTPEERAIDPTQGGYSIIVASRTSEEQADGVVDRFRTRLADDDLPVEVLRGQSGGVTRYRIGVGQFSTVTEAQETLARLGDVLPSDAWITRLEADM